MLDSLFKKNKFFGTFLRKQEKWKLQQQWRETFASETKRQTGKWVCKGNDWHTFSYGFSPCIKGYEAENIFDSIFVNQIYCISSNEDISACHYRCNECTLPKSKDIAAFLEGSPEFFDLYIVSSDFEWTMVFLHEHTLGPYYADKRMNMTESYPSKLCEFI